MAFTDADLAAIDAAIASGELKIRSPDGSEVTYRSLDEMRRQRELIRRELGEASAVRRGGAYRVRMSKGL